MKLNDVHMYHVQHCAVTLWHWGYSNLKLIRGYGDDSICDGASKIHLGGLRFRGIIDKFSSGRISTEKRMKICMNSLSSPRKFTWNWRWFADLRLVENVEGKVVDIRPNFVFQPACMHLINPSLAVFLPQLWLDNQIINRNKNYNCRNLLLSTVSGLSNFLSTISLWTSSKRSMRSKCQESRVKAQGKDHFLLCPSCKCGLKWK